MYPLKQRTASDGVIAHSVIDPRVYDNDPNQVDRIRRAQIYVSKNFNLLPDGPRSIVELGCGTADISGPFAFEHDVVGVDCNERALEVAKKRFSKIITLQRSIHELEPISCDVLILCETLEHLEDPLALVRRWLPVAKTVVISHPLDESVDSSLSGGEHQWGFSELDFASWFNVGGHKIVEETQFQMGNYKMIMGRGRRTE